MLADTIREITASHLRNGGVFLCQNATDNGYVQNTVPHDEDLLGQIIILPTSDVSNSGIVCGFALAGKRPIYGIRYQGFSWLNNSNLVNYAAKSKQMWGVPCPIFIRAVGMEGAIGPTASHMHHSAVCRMPGIKVFAPMSIAEYRATWQEFMDGDDPVFCSEHRTSYKSDVDYYNDSFCVIGKQPTIIAMGAARFNALRAVEILKEKGIEVNLVHLWQLKPLVLDDSIGHASSKVLVIDSDYEFGGFGSQVALECHKRYNIPVDVMGLEDRVAGFSPETDVLTPSVERIVSYFVKS